MNNKNFPELAPCPFCGKSVSWCCTIPDEEGDHITCTHCGYDFNCLTEKSFIANSFDAMREEAARVWNNRPAQNINKHEAITGEEILIQYEVE